MRRSRERGEPSGCDCPRASVPARLRRRARARGGLRAPRPSADPLHRKGDKCGPNGASVEPTGAWILDSRISEKNEVEDHVESILALLTSDHDEWASLTERFSASILCGIFLDQYNEGFELSPRLCKALANRGLVIAFDIYSGDPDA